MLYCKKLQKRPRGVSVNDGDKLKKAHYNNGIFDIESKLSFPSSDLIRQSSNAISLPSNIDDISNNKGLDRDHVNCKGKEDQIEDEDEDDEPDVIGDQESQEEFNQRIANNQSAKTSRSENTQIFTIMEYFHF